MDLFEITFPPLSLLHLHRPLANALNFTNALYLATDIWFSQLRKRRKSTACNHPAAEPFEHATEKVRTSDVSCANFTY